jgi:hypothetical protein
MLLPVLGQADTKHVVPAPYMYMALLQTAQAVARARSAHVACVKADMVEDGEGAAWRLIYCKRLATNIRNFQFTARLLSTGFRGAMASASPGGPAAGPSSGCRSANDACTSSRPPSRRATLSFYITYMYTAIHCHWLSFLRDLHESNLAVIARCHVLPK